MDDPGAYCREIETYLCRRNDGHLIRIVGPAFERVCGWAEAGVPLQVVVQGIDRKLERYQPTGRKRRPLRIEYCEADIFEVFDEWRRAVGVAGAPDRSKPDAEAGETAPREHGRPARRRVSLPAHIDRVLVQSTNLLAMREAVPGLHAALEQVVADLDALRRDARGARGAARAVLLDRLDAIDRGLIAAARTAAGSAIEGIEDAACAELAPFKTRMAQASYARALTACTDRLLRERFRLPTVRFDG
ncbi:MAG: hypothetical protein QF681_03590 [Vicinamibacterales bacterium]|jgi:hypothetical protein|nr:hypothetical protein [Vicinamibacterales bacterium]